MGPFGWAETGQSPSARQPSVGRGPEWGDHSYLHVLPPPQGLWWGSGSEEGELSENGAVRGGEMRL